MRAAAGSGRQTLPGKEIQFPTRRRKSLPLFKTRTTIDGILAFFECGQRELSAFRFLVLHILDSNVHGIVCRCHALDQHAIAQIVQSLSLQIGFLVTLNGDSVLECVLVSFVAIDSHSVIEVDVKFPGCDTAALQFHLNGLYIALPAVPDGKAKPHDPFLTIVGAVKIAAIQTESQKVRRIEVGQIAQRVNAATLLGPAFPELEMQMGIGRIFLTHRADHIALVHMSAWNHTLRDAVEMEIDKKQVFLSIRRIEDFENDMS